MSTKKIQRNVLVGNGEKVFYKEIKVDFSNITPYPGIFTVENINKRIEVIYFIICGDVIVFSIKIYLGITYSINNYSFYDEEGNVTTTGKIRFILKCIEYNDCLEINKFKVDEILQSDKVEVVKLEFIGSKEELLDPIEVYKTDNKVELDKNKKIEKEKELTSIIHKYEKLKESISFKIKVNILREEYIDVEVDEEK